MQINSIKTLEILQKKQHFILLLPYLFVPLFTKCYSRKIYSRKI